MIRTRVWVLACALAAATGVRAADKPLYRPEPAWVRRLPIPLDMKPSGAAVDVLLWTSQSRFAPGDDETFVEQASRINAPEGLQQAGSLIEAWDPSTETLAIHRAQILRGGEVIDLLAGGKTFTVLRRETSLEAATLDGELTATLQPEGLQVGDVLDIAVTLAQREPALAGHSEGGAASGHAGTVGRLAASISWPAGRPFRTWKTDDVSALTPVTRDGWTEVGFDHTDAVSPDPPKGAPLSDQLFGMMMAGDFAGWKDVSANSYPLYAKASTLSAGSPLQTEIARIRASSRDPKARALSALELVEGRTRYFALLMNAGGLTPAPADLTWSRRYGDCKGKTVLLLALLHGLGIEAEPALVNTVFGEGLDRALPQMGAFDHVIVRATLAGRVYWLDGTRMGDENLDVIPIPNYRWALPVRAGGAELEPLAPPPPPLPLVETDEAVDLSAGVDKPSPVHREMTLRGDAGWAFSLLMKQASRIDADRALKQVLTAGQDWIAPDKVAFAYDPQKMEARATLDGSGTPPFANADGVTTGERDWMIDGSEIGYEANFTRRSDYHRDAPYAVAYPVYNRTTIEVKLPLGGKAFETVNGEAVNRTMAGMTYTRAAAVNEGRFVMVASSRALAQSFPAAEASADAQSLRSVADYQVSLRYTPAAAAEPAVAGGVAATPAAPTPVGAAAVADPAQAAEDAFLADDYPGAEAGFTKLLAAHPSAKLYYDRAAVRAAQGHDADAKADMAAALKLDPKDGFAEFGLGRYALRDGDMLAAARRFAAAERDSADPDKIDVQIARAYDAAKAYGEAYAYWDRVAAATPAADKRAVLLNTVCWNRATAGADLKDALAACDAALQAAPGQPDALDSRGLVDLRLSTPEKAVSDYSAALAKRPDLWTSLYGRGLAERRLGQAARADTDVAAARAIHPDASADFAKWGVDR